MKKSDIRKLIDTDQFFEEVQKLASSCNCSLLDALEEYARRKEIDIDLVAAIVKSHRGKFKTDLEKQCVALNMVMSGDTDTV